MYDTSFFNKKNFIDKLDEAIFFRYGSPKNNTEQKKYRAFYNDFRHIYPDSIDISQAVRSWRSFSDNNITRLPQLTQLIQICNVLDCDIDFFLTPQKNLRKNISNTAQVTGLSYQTIENINVLYHNKDLGSCLLHQCIDLILSNFHNINAVIGNLSKLIFTIDKNETEIIEKIYDSKIEEKYKTDPDNYHGKCFVDTISDSNFNYFIEFENNLFYPAHFAYDDESSICILDLAKKLDKIRLSITPNLSEFKGDIKILLDTEYVSNEEMYLEWLELEEKHNDIANEHMQHINIVFE